MIIHPLREDLLIWNWCKNIIEENADSGWLQGYWNYRLNFMIIFSHQEMIMRPSTGHGGGSQERTILRWFPVRSTDLGTDEQMTERCRYRNAKRKHVLGQSAGRFKDNEQQKPQQSMFFQGFLSPILIKSHFLPFVNSGSTDGESTFQVCCSLHSDWLKPFG